MTKSSAERGRAGIILRVRVPRRGFTFNEARPRRHKKGDRNGNRRQIWLKNYPKGVPADIDVNQYESLVQLLDEAFKKYGSLPAYTCMA